MSIEEQLELLMQGTEYGDPSLEQSMRLELRQLLLEDRPLKVLAKDHEENLTKLNSIVDGKYLVKDGWVGKRATTKDYLPITGKIKNFYINVGHGSKGTANAPFCSQYIADLIDNMPVNMDSELTGCLSPERFIS